MDYESDSSDFHFPSDTGLAKLSSPLSFKVPESRDWALDEFMQTLSSKPCMETDNLTSFKQYIPVQKEDDDNDDFNYGPPKLNLPTFEEKEFLTQLSQHFIDLERKELHDILKGGFSLVQNDIQKNTASNNNAASPFASAHPDISWFDEAYEYGHHNTNIISNLENVDFTRKANTFSPFDQHQQTRIYNNSTVASVSILSDILDDSDDLLEEQDVPQPIEIQESLSALPLPVITTTVPQLEKKGLKYKLKSKLIKTFKPTTNHKQEATPLFLKNTRKFIRKIFPSSQSSNNN